MHSSDNKNNAPLDRRIFCLSAISLATLGATACGGSGGSFTGGGAFVGAAPPATPAAVDPSSEPGDPAVAPPPPSPPQPRKFAHPGLLHTESDFERMRQKVKDQAQPWLDGWNALTGNGRAQLGAKPRPLATVIRGGDGQNFAQMYIDIARAYQLALRWKVSQDKRYADLAVVFLNTWSSTLTTVTGNADRFLAAGIYGYQFANAAEIMRTYDGWAAEDFARFQNMMLTVFYPLNHSFLTDHNGTNATGITNYWANWDQCTMASMLAIGVLCDRLDIYDEAISYYKTGQGNGAGLQAVYHVHPGYLGQWQESGRDQGHCTLGIGLAGAFCEMAWNQGDDIYGYENNRFLAGAEYVAKSNLRDGSDVFYTVPYFTNVNRQGTQSVLSTGSQGSRRPVWESVHNHYANRLGIATPYTALQVAQMHPEGDGSGGDQLGFGTLTFTRDPLPAAVRPSGLTARLRGAQVALSWWGCTGALSYSVQRAEQAGGPYAEIASGIADVLTFTDTSVRATGIYYYVIVAATASGASAPSGEARVAMQPELLLQWKADSSTTAPVSLSAGLAKNVADFTVAARVFLDSAATWSRVFDFGSGPRRYMMLTPRSNAGAVRYAISTVHGYNEQVINGTAPLPTGRWVHVAVTLSGTLGTLYVDGAVVGTNAQMTLAPFDLGETTQNWLGRSQFSNDPDLQGRVDDLRLYSGALGPTEIAALVQA
ncbi:alginate lyase family protein [Variovorax sp. ZS18.2.2]|uniref:LamG-like jellyroll fold domain-containing protein n=1 Tax=Variovorax sp. ZS18.2.2 TaxID=2971255 RepID=UPI002151D1E6|nr:LamG-like jellyroll fold domain-containing protein [Variovorax sp. ZS18.2.2]MCR6478159.1 alginate lyase family protein [Variovorax sp. ZS18.2.2]